MDKLTAIKIKYDDNTYSEEIPIGISIENVDYDNTHNLLQVIGDVDLSAGSIQSQIDELLVDIASVRHAVGSPLVAATASAMTNIDKIYVYTGSETGYVNGNWYYYDGTDWVSGGIYNSVAVETDVNLVTPGMAADAAAVGAAIPQVDDDLDTAGAAADAKATGDALTEINERLNLDETAAFTTEAELITRDSYKTGAYQINSAGNWIYRNDGAFASAFELDKYPAKPNTRYCGRAYIYAACCAVAFVDSNDNVLGVLGYPHEQGYSFKAVFFDGVSPAGTAYLYAMRTPTGYTLATEYNKTLYKSSVMSLLRNETAETPREDVTGAIAYSGGVLALRTNGAWSGWLTAKYTVCPGEVITVRGAYSNVNPIGAFVDASGNMTPIWRDEQNTSYTVFCREATVTVPANICEVWVNSYNTWSLPNRTIYKHNLAYKGCFEGKKWYVIGDSITEYNTTANIKYYDYIQMRTGILPINLAKGGRGYINGSSTDDKQFYKQALELGNDADVVTILGGGNDVSSYPLGEITDTGTDTICGCINKAIDNVYTTLPLAKLGIITPNPWGSFPPYTDNAMARLAEAIRQICSRRGIPCLDLYHCSGMRPWETQYKELVYSLSNNDGVHPNNIGHDIMAAHIEQFVKELLIN